MKFSKKLIEGKFLKRYKRFFADIEIDGETAVAHVPNSGSMKGCNTPYSTCLVTYSNDPKRKLKYTLEMIQAPNSWVGVNTQVPNKIVKEALQDWLYKDYAMMFCEAKINEKSRLDFALSKDLEVNFKKVDLKNGADKFHFIEVKNVSLVENDIAKFPDAVTERGQKHLEDLMQLIDWGHTAEILFTIQRTDGKVFSPASDIDPKYAQLLKKAYDHGVIISPYLVDLSPEEVKLSEKKLPLTWL